MQTPPLPALPQCQVLLLADYLIRDALTGKFSVLGLFHTIHSRAFPFTHQNLVVYGVVTEIHGTVPLTFRLVRSADDAVLYEAQPLTVTAADPTEAVELIDRVPAVVFPAPGEYRLEATTGGEVVAARRFQVRQAAATNGKAMY
jgi:hypothetical protein